jgi:hypothetical protein
VTLPLALLLLVMAVVGLVCVVFGRSPVPWSRLRQVERHWVRAYGGFLVLLAATVTAAEAFDAVGVTYGSLPPRSFRRCWSPWRTTAGRAAERAVRGRGRGGNQERPADVAGMDTATLHRGSGGWPGEPSCGW